MKSSSHLRGSPPDRNLVETLTAFWRMQPALARWSYVAGMIGVLLAVHDYHHPQDTFGYSTPVLGVAIVLYLLSLRRSSRH